MKRFGEIRKQTLEWTGRVYLRPASTVADTGLASADDEYIDLAVVLGLEEEGTYPMRIIIGPKEPT